MALLSTAGITYSIFFFPKKPPTQAHTCHHRLQTGSTPLHQVARFGNKETALALIEHGADVNCQDLVDQHVCVFFALSCLQCARQYRKTPIMFALEQLEPNTSVATILLDHGAALHIPGYLDASARKWLVRASSRTDREPRALTLAL